MSGEETPMSEAPRRRLLDHLGTSPTFLAEGSRVVGDFELPGPLVVLGHVRGNARVAGPVSIASKAEWHGDIAARQAVIAGQVVGNLEIEEKLEIGASARIRGQISARSIAIARGAVIEGEVRVTSSEPVASFEEKRAS
jgi:cytoskeletal protein CcmA (bactofilin family)